MKDVQKELLWDSTVLEFNFWPLRCTCSPYICDSIAQSPNCSIARSIDRMVDGSLDVSIDRSIARSLDLSIARPLENSLTRLHIIKIYSEHDRKASLEPIPQLLLVPSRDAIEHSAALLDLLSQLPCKRPCYRRFQTNILRAKII